MESDSTCLHFTLLYYLSSAPIHQKHPRLTRLHVDFISAQYNGNVLANPLEITVPVGHVLVCDSRGNVEHDDATLALNIVAIAKTAKLLLTSRVPDIKTDFAEVRRETEGVDFDAKSRWWFVSRTPCTTGEASDRGEPYRCIFSRIHQSGGAARFQRSTHDHR